MLTDSRDGKTYKTIEIGNQTWMAENLNYDASDSVCYNNDPANCEKYGRLYNWETVMKVCPSGWHLPSNSEWDELDKYVGGEKIAGKKLKAKNGWNGTDEFGFSALPGGIGDSDGSFFDVGSYGYLWSSSNNDGAYSRYMHYNNEDVLYYRRDKSYLFSVRCLQD